MREQKEAQCLNQVDYSVQLMIGRGDSMEHCYLLAKCICWLILKTLILAGNLNKPDGLTYEDSSSYEEVLQFKIDFVKF